MAIIGAIGVAGASILLFTTGSWITARYPAYVEPTQIDNSTWAVTLREGQATQFISVVSLDEQNRMARIMTQMVNCTTQEKNETPVDLKVGSTIMSFPTAVSLDGIEVGNANFRLTAHPCGSGFA